MYKYYLDLIAQFATSSEAILDTPLGYVTVHASEEESKWTFTFCLGEKALPKRFFRWQQEALELKVHGNMVYLVLSTPPAHGYVSFKTLMSRFLEEITFWHSTLKEVDTLAFC